ncbi:putative MPP superfamily phosphohydrolase [Ereboglobus sp. PH5-5]|uniref:metallophosphoesterase n=1 Tax=unclassified Ereboglobus TaxID=2626932 RepID=UPI002405D7B4|nr:MULTISPECIES: metallophosphoesterase [unclassified Ereboglobus]MDF9827011.1 putative MPP superfamily phosphohydrolase [Ereboglobus sp. PH5-10]MDF9832033.1 putative MPP superfamily phosphohydrolase [Ereboglobus sp. PH5-5]
MSSLVFIIFLVVYLLLCACIFVRSTQALPKKRWLRIVWVAGLAFFASAFFTGSAFRETVVAGVPVGHWLRVLGVTWMLTFPYWVVAVVFWEVIRLVNKRRRILPKCVETHYARAKVLALAVTVAAVIVVFAFGYWRFSNPVVTPLAVKINKPLGGQYAGSGKVLRIAVASDLHLGDIIGRERVRDFVTRINALQPNIILLPGDVVDRSVDALEKQNMGAELEKLHAPLGVFAVLGNHEKYANAKRSLDFLEKHGIRVLYDEAIPLANGAFTLAGRADHSIKPRKTLDEILVNADRAHPIILMDHQPRELARAQAAGVDLQFSGHTHAGQVWPVTWIVRFMYEVPYGHARKGDFQVYVTSGLGLWGFPARIGSKSEIVDVTVEFAK